MSETGIVNIRGKDYHTVAKRVADFREKHPLWSIRTAIEVNTDAMILVKAEILDHKGTVMSQGHAEEVRTDTGVNSTSALENAETSAVGRALAFLGFGGSHIASADEMAQAAIQQDLKGAYSAAQACMQAFINNYESVIAIQQSISNNDLSSAKEAWHEIDEDTQRALWLATSKGGCFTTEERRIMKSNEFSAA